MLKALSKPVSIAKPLLMLIMLCALMDSARAQDLTPRAYWPAPKDTNVISMSYVYQQGDVVTDPSLPITGVDSKLHDLSLTYQRTLNLFGRTSNLQFRVPWVTGDTSGLVEGIQGRRDLQGFGDVSATLSINLAGAPSMSVEEFREFRANPRPLVAAGLTVVAPTGDYDKNRLINIGTNRWATRARLGYIQPLSEHWVLESSAGIWFFEDNDEFLGKTRSQDSIYALDFSLIRRMKPGFWASLDLNYYFGGRTYVDNSKFGELLDNSRVGLTLVYPFENLGALRLSYSNGVITNTGGDYDNLGIAWLFVFR